LPYSSVASTSIPAVDAQTPTSASAAVSASSSRAAYGAPEAPVMPRKTRTESPGAYRPSPRGPWILLRPLPRLEEDGEVVQIVLAEVGEGLHRRARGHAARALDVVDRELDALLLRAFRREIGRPEVRAAGAVVRMAVHAPHSGEDLGPRERLRVPRV